MNNDHILSMIRERFGQNKHCKSTREIKRKYRLYSKSQLNTEPNKKPEKSKNNEKTKRANKNIFINLSVNQNLCLNIPEKKKTLDITDFINFVKNGKEGRSVLINRKN